MAECTLKGNRTMQRVAVRSRAADYHLIGGTEAKPGLFLLLLSVLASFYVTTMAASCYPLRNTISSQSAFDDNDRKSGERARY